MKVNIAEPVLDYDAEPVLDGDGEDARPITYKRLILDSLNSPTDGPTWDGDSKMRCFDISVKMAGQDIVDFDDEERAFIKERAAKILFPLYLGRLRAVLSDPT